MKDNEIIAISDYLDQMEATEGWKWLKADIEKDMDELIDDILEKSDSDISRGKLKYARSIFEKIQRIHQNKSQVQE